MKHESTSVLPKSKASLRIQRDEKGNVRQDQNKRFSTNFHSDIKELLQSEILHFLIDSNNYQVAKLIFTENKY